MSDQKSAIAARKLTLTHFCHGSLLRSSCIFNFQIAETLKMTQSFFMTVWLLLAYALKLTKHRQLLISTLERVGIDSYACWDGYFHVFELAENYDIDVVSNIFRCGYQAIKKRSAIVGCEAVPDLSSKQDSMLKLREYGDKIEDFTVKDLRSTDFPSFSELKEKNFPASTFRAEDLCPHGVWPAPGEGLLMTFVRPNPIRGGVILSWYILHAWADQTTIHEWARFTPIPFTPTELPPNLAADNHLGDVFYFSPESVRKLKVGASPENAKITPESERPEWISTADAMAALIWRSVMSAQHDLDTMQSNPQSILAGTLDVRRRMHVPIHPQTLGNFWALSHTTMDIRSNLAIAVRRTLQDVNRQSYYDEIASLVEQLEDVHRLPMIECARDWLHSHDLGRYPLFDLNWGTALGKVQSMRLPVTGMLQCLEAVLPRLPDGGLEVYVGVEKSRLDRLRKNPEWRRFAELR
ncbi:trichothecene 3-o-acetyltransferase [Phyllosticta citricarpa]|uniref:Trichothecene 3-o-acetyltransferase n=1 Tax=Phyllosticta citricarpa TaxID=55181 RepID=A0ABR1LHH3_9PEZI